MVSAVTLPKPNSRAKWNAKKLSGCGVPQQVLILLADLAVIVRPAP
jgi:hypothetical protein